MKGSAGGTQVKFSDRMGWLHSGLTPRPDMETVEFVGSVTASHTAGPPIARAEHEIRRRDIGPQRYGGETPTQDTAYTDRHGLLQKPRNRVHKTVDTTFGNVTLTAHDPDLGFLPTANVVDFLRHEYVGSRHNAYPPRYHPT